MGLRWAAVALSFACFACGPSTSGEPPTREPPATGAPSEPGESTLPEEALALELLRGDAAAARAGFERLLADQVALVDRLLERDPEDTTELARAANAVRRVASIARSWQAAELELRRRGSATPPAVLSRVLSAARQMDAHAQAIGAVEAALPRAAREDHRTRDISAVRRDVGRGLLQCNVFLRGTAQEGSRRELIDAARRYVDAPAGVEAFDEQYGPDPEGAFNLTPPVPPRPRAAATTRSRAEAPRALGGVEGDAELLAFLRGWAEAVIAGDLSALERMLAAGLAPPREELAREAAELDGWSVAELGAVYAGPRPDGTIAIAIESMGLRGPGGEERTTRADLVVRAAPGGYEVVQMGAVR